jgi:toxin YoeB
MNLTFTPSAWDDYQWFAKHDRKLLKRINQLLEEVRRSPLEGIGKPEPLKGDLAGFWSRRINDEHRLVYSVRGDDILVIACRYHYSA